MVFTARIITTLVHCKALSFKNVRITAIYAITSRLHEWSQYRRAFLNFCPPWMERDSYYNRYTMTKFVASAYHYFSYAAPFRRISKSRRLRMNRTHFVFLYFVAIALIFLLFSFVGSVSKMFYFWSPRRALLPSFMLGVYADWLTNFYSPW